MGFKLWEDLLLGRLMPSVSSTVTALVIVLLFMWLFRVRNPGTRYILLHLPLIKGLVVLIRGVPAPLPGFEAGLRFGFQLFDPFAVLTVPDMSGRAPGVGFQRIELVPEWDSAVLHAAFFMAVGAAIGVLAYRWVGLSLFYRRLLSRPSATRAELPEVFGLLDRLVPAFGVAYPRIVLLEETPLAPCTLGVRPATMILPLRLLRQLDQEQLEAIVAHELAHVSRWDGLLHWPSLLLRDLQFFNPLAHRLFGRLLVEREIDSDLRAGMKTGHPRAIARVLVDLALLAKGVDLRAAPGAMSFSEIVLGGRSVLEERVRALAVGPVCASRLRPLGIVLLFVYLVLVRLYVHFPVLGHVVMLE